MNPVETATLAELLAELERRSSIGLVLVEAPPPDGTKAMVRRHWGDRYRLVGAMHHLVMPLFDMHGGTDDPDDDLRDTGL